MECDRNSLAAVSSQDKLTGATFHPFSSCSDLGEAKNSGNFNGERSLHQILSGDDCAYRYLVFLLPGELETSPYL